MRVCVCCVCVCMCVCVADTHTCVCMCLCLCVCFVCVRSHTGIFELHQSQTKCDQSQTVDTPLRLSTATVESPFLSHTRQIRLTAYYTPCGTRPVRHRNFEFLRVRSRCLSENKLCRNISPASRRRSSRKKLFSNAQMPSVYVVCFA